MVDEAWERAVEAALHAGGEGSSSPARSLTLDGAVKCMHGRLPAAEILERHQNLEHLSIAGVGVTSLEGFPRLRNLTRLTLSDNRIAGGLDHLVAAGLSSLRDLDLSNNRIQDVAALAPLAALRLVSLDLYECPVTRVKDYRSRVFGMIRTLKYLDKMDADENERPESDDEYDDGEGDGDGDGDEGDDDDDDEDEDPGSGEVANGGFSHSRGGLPAHPVEVNGVIDVDEDESDADEVLPNGGVEHHHGVNGFRVAAVGEAPDEEDEDVDEEDEEDEDDCEAEDDLGEEIDEDGDEEDPVVEVHDVPSSDEEEDGVEDDDEDDEDDEEEVEDDEEVEPQSSGRVAMVTGEVGGEIDGHEHGEGDDEDENGEIGEEDDGRLEDDRVYEEGHDDDDDADDEDEDTEYLVQPIARPSPGMAIGSDEPQAMAIRSNFDAADPDDADEDRDEVDDDEGATDQPSSSQGAKRKRGDEPSGSGDDDEDDGVRGFETLQAPLTKQPMYMDPLLSPSSQLEASSSSSRRRNRYVSKKKDAAGDEKAPAAAGKPAAAKPKKAPVKPLPEMMQEEIIPPLKAALEAEEDVSQVQLAFQNNTLEGSFVKNDVPYYFWAFFPQGDLTGPKGFSLSSYSNEVSTIEPFLVDERKVTAKFVVFWVYKRLAGQGILPVWKDEDGQEEEAAK